MVKNEELERIVLAKMTSTLKDYPKLSIVAEGNEELTKNIIQSMGELRINEEHKIRFHFSVYIGYGYDFDKQSGGKKTTKEIYEHAVRNTKKLRDVKHVEQIIAEGIEKDRFGWYITTFP